MIDKDSGHVNTQPDGGTIFNGGPVESLRMERSPGQSAVPRRDAVRSFLVAKKFYCGHAALYYQA